MKKVLLAIIVFAVTGLSSCKKDEEVRPVKKEATSAGKCRNCGNGGWD